MDILSGLLVGVGSGVSRAFVGFAKSPGEPIDWSRVAVTTVIGAIAGVINSLTGTNIDQLLLVFANTGLTVYIEDLLKAIFRRSKPAL